MNLAAGIERAALHRVAHFYRRRKPALANEAAKLWMAVNNPAFEQIAKAVI